MKTRFGMEKAAFTLGLLLIFFLVGPAFSMEKEKLDENRVSSTFEARVSVEKAWEVYHHAALGGTLASPTVQTRLEENLHRSRALLAEAYEAEDMGDRIMMEKRVKQIMKITNQVIAGSQEPKK